MGNRRQILEEINKLTYMIETDYPELYQFLDENPMTIPSEAHPEVDTEALKVYLEGLTQILEHYKVTHKINDKQS
ncbi:MAG: hypothetical protein E4H26_00480 [Flavobacteriales bacterium]|nr:MAG: hypothetical protein E4H26_00480 [Flavobacteriales bacterium]